MIVTQTTVITLTWREHDEKLGERLINDGFKCEICTAGITYSKTQITSWKLGKENE